MKRTLIACILLLLSLAGRAQDQVKVQNSADVLEGRIFKADWATLRMRLADGVEKRVAMEYVDSIYTQNDTILKELQKRNSTRSKLSHKFLVGPKILVAKTSVVIDTNAVADKSTAKVLNATQLSLDKINTRLINAGNAYNSAATCYLLGSLSMAVGSIILGNDGGQVPGIILISAGTLLNLGGTGYLLNIGNMLKGTYAKDLDVGIGGNGVGMRMKF